MLRGQLLAGPGDGGGDGRILRRDQVYDLERGGPVDPGRAGVAALGKPGIDGGIHPWK